MGSFSDTVEARRRERSTAGLPPPAGVAAPPPAGAQRRKQLQQQRTRVSPLVYVVAGAAVLLPLASSLGWLDGLQRALERRGVRLPWRRRGGEAGGAGGGGRSAFSFPKGKAAARATPAPPAAAASSLPRNKQSANKKGKSRKAEVRDERAAKREEKAAGVYTGPAGGAGTLPESGSAGPSSGRGGSTRVVQLNNVPKDDDILGGAEGKTFTTTSKYKTSEMYARIREERGNI